MYTASIHKIQAQSGMWATHSTLHIRRHEVFLVCSVLSLKSSKLCVPGRKLKTFKVLPVLDTFTTATHKLGEIFLFNSQGQMILQPVEKKIP